MPVAVTDYGGELIMAVITGQAVMPGVLYLALLNTVPDVTWDGTDVAFYEPIDSAYARQGILTTSVGWGPTDGGACSNSLELVWATPTVDWGDIGWWALCDDPVAGNVVLVGDLVTQTYVQANGSVTMDPGSINLSVASLTDYGADT